MNLQVEKTADTNEELKSCFQSVHSTMTEVRSRLENLAILRNLTTLCPIVDNKTRWSGKCYMLRRFCRIYDNFQAVSESESSTVSLNLTTAFKAEVTRFSAQLSEIDTVIKLLQTNKFSLSECRMALDALVHVISEKKDDGSSALFNCMLTDTHIGKSSHLVTDKAFEFGVVKIQRNSISTLTAAEKRAFKNLVIASSESPAEPFVDSEPTASSFG